MVADSSQHSSHSFNTRLRKPISEIRGAGNTKTNTRRPPKKIPDSNDLSKLFFNEIINFYSNGGFKKSKNSRFYQEFINWNKNFLVPVGKFETKQFLNIFFSFEKIFDKNFLWNSKDITLRIMNNSLSTLVSNRQFKTISSKFVLISEIILDNLSRKNLSQVSRKDKKQIIQVNFPILKKYFSKSKERVFLSANFRKTRRRSPNYKKNKRVLIAIYLFLFLIEILFNVQFININLF